MAEDERQPNKEICLKITSLNAKDCQRWDFANRSQFEFGDIARLAQDIKANGQIEPVIARPSKTKNIQFDIIAGTRRWKACLEYDLELMAIVKSLDDVEAFYYQLKENEKAPISDYSQGIHLAKMLAESHLTLNKASSMMGYSKSKLTNLLTFAKVPNDIWLQVNNMSKVSSKASEMIYRLSNKGQTYIEAIINISDDIRKGLGAEGIEKAVLKQVLGDNAKIEYHQPIKTVDGRVLAYWTKSGIKFEKGVAVNQEKVDQAIINALTTTDTA